MNKTPKRVLLEQLWSFALGVLQPPQFEKWLYLKHEDLQDELDESVLSGLLEADYEDAKRVEDARSFVHAYLSQLPRSCECPLLKPIDHRGLGHTDEIESTHVRKKERTPWLHLIQCGACGTYWYVAHDTCDDDVHFQRLTESEAVAVLSENSWPKTFDSLEAVWPLQQK